MNRLFQSLFRKDEKYALIWSYIVSLHEYLENIRLEIPSIITKFGIPRTTLLRIIQYGCTKLDIRYSLKNGIIQFHCDDMKKNDDPKQMRLDVGDADIPVIPASDAAEAIVNQKKKTAKEMTLNEFAKEVIQYLNEKTGKHYPYDIKKGKKNIGHISTLRNEGYNLHDFFKVIDIKCDEWGGDPYWSNYLRPSTLFNSKFNEYLNQGRETPMMKMHGAIANAKPESRRTKITDALNRFNDLVPEHENEQTPENDQEQQ